VRTAVPDDGFTLLGTAAAAAFLGGTSAYGRRGGVFGTVLAAGFLQLAALWLGLVEAQPWTRPALLGGAIVLGLLVGRVVEAAGSTEPPPPDDVDEDAGPETQLWDPYGTGSFARPGTDPYPTGGFTPAASYREGAEPYWPGQAPAPEDEPAAAEPTRDLGAYREPGGNAGQFREPGRGTER
jgi:predicted outer membrane lipoprotein